MTLVLRAAPKEKFHSLPTTVKTSETVISSSIFSPRPWTRTCRLVIRLKSWALRGPFLKCPKRVSSGRHSRLFFLWSSNLTYLVSIKIGCRVCQDSSMREIRSGSENLCINCWRYAGGTENTSSIKATDVILKTSVISIIITLLSPIKLFKCYFIKSVFDRKEGLESIIIIRNRIIFSI